MPKGGLIGGQISKSFRACLSIIPDMKFAVNVYLGVKPMHHEDWSNEWQTTSSSQGLI